MSLLIQKYLCDEKWKKPLCLAVFGPPGSGKSFTIKEILKSVQSNKSGDPLVYNLAQFNSIEDLISAFHQVQDRALAEEVPLIIFDEFDAQFERPFGWLKYFLAPMQDGVFKGHGGTYQIGRAIFVFAGGMHSTFSDFDKDKDSQDYAEFKSAKGPDFISRLRGHLDIKGIDSPNGISNSVMFHRAVVLRSLLEKHAKNIINGKKGKAEIHDELIRAFLKISRYEHGVRSMEAIIQMSQFDKEGFVKASLPRQQQLNMHVNADDFMKLVDLE